MKQLIVISLTIVVSHILSDILSLKGYEALCPQI